MIGREQVFDKRCGLAFALIILVILSYQTGIFESNSENHTSPSRLTSSPGGVQVDFGNNETISSNPTIAVSKTGITYAVWKDSRLPDNTPQPPIMLYVPCYNIYFSKSLDGGNTFSDDICINDYRENVTHVRPNMVIGADQQP